MKYAEIRIIIVVVTVCPPCFGIIMGALTIISLETIVTHQSISRESCIFYTCQAGIRYRCSARHNWSLFTLKINILILMPIEGRRTDIFYRSRDNEGGFFYLINSKCRVTDKAQFAIELEVFERCTVCECTIINLVEVLGESNLGQRGFLDKCLFTNSLQS